jgi:D-aspartate ligase
METAPFGPATTVPAIVLGSGVTAVGVIRSLREHGVKTLVAAREGIATRARGITLLPDVTEAKSTPSLLPELLARLDLAAAVLMPCDDDWIRAVVGSWEEVSSVFHPTIPEPSVIERLIDKDAFARTVEEVGVPHPRTFEVTSIDDLDRLSDAEFGSFFLKPCDSQRFTRRFHRKAFPLGDRDQARGFLEGALADGHRLLAQERIPGPPEQHVFVDGYRARSGTVLGVLARRRLRMFPPRFGNSTDSVTIPLSEARDAVDSALALLEAIGFHGMFDAEFKLDARTGRHTIIEVNVRPWWQLELSRAAGIDVAWLAYRDALGQTVPPVDGYRIGRRWVHTFPDLRARLAGGAVRVPNVRKESWFTARHAVIALSDPGPGLGELARVAHIAAGVVMRRLRERTRSFHSNGIREAPFSSDDRNPR